MIPPPPIDAERALEKRTHWRVFRKPPTLAELAVEPTGIVLTALVRTIRAGNTEMQRRLVVKVGDHRWLSVVGATYAECVAAWRSASARPTDKLVDDAALAALLPTASYAWCINRMYTAAGTLPPKRKRTRSKTAAR